MLIRLWKYLCGYVIIEVYGFSIERFMNLATHKGIYLWDLKRDGSKLQMAISIKGFKMLKPCARKTRCRIKVVKKIGLPFLFHHYRKRRVFLFGFLLTLVILWVLSSFIWTIEVEGNRHLSMHQIKGILEAEGCKIGQLKYKIDPDEVEDHILENYSGISWISMEIRGTGLFVNIEETVETPEIVEKELPSTNIVADKDCLIQYIVTRSGRPLVKKGDVIQKGDLLVTGELEILNDDQTFRYSYVNADADIIGRVYYIINDSLKWDYIQKNYTGKKKKELIFKMGQLKLNFSNPFKTFEEYDYTTEVSDFYFLNYKLPFEIHNRTCNEYVPETLTYSEEEAKEIIDRRVNRLIEETFNEEVEIINQEIVYTNKENAIDCEVRITVLETIGEVEAIKERKEEWTQEEETQS
ncbi:sporulation protein YqfD [Vallitalea okinawensis]|uniref:sporulation protein YqfD n=1 Tax=Vallitalea okinawensis TaxID=2078660 RepID=UPI000CFC96D0|nr:sporulation protein YqfD [Vallitalea okinawensis]